MTYLDKQNLYREGKYSCPVPPVSTSLWTEDSWIRWVDAKGHWTTD